MKILVTGGAGFIGSHLVDRLLSEGNQVVVVDNLILGKKENIQHNLKIKEFRFYKEDLLDIARIERIFLVEKFEMVFHLAANSDIQKGGINPDVDNNLTYLTTFNVLKCMRKFNVKKIVFASTSAIYGETSAKLTEDFGPLLPVSLYGAAKLASEGFISAFVANYGFQAWIVRFPNVVGERFTHGVIYDFVRKLKKDPFKLEVLGNGEQYKPYCYVKDLVEGILFCWKKASANINIYNLGVETRTKVKEIAQMVISEMKLNAEIVYTGGDRGWIGDVPEFNYDLSKVHALGWKAARSSNEAVRLAIQKALEFEMANR